MKCMLYICDIFWTKSSFHLNLIWTDKLKIAIHNDKKGIVHVTMLPFLLGSSLCLHIMLTNSL